MSHLQHHLLLRGQYFSQSCDFLACAIQNYFCFGLFLHGCSVLRPKMRELGVGFLVLCSVCAMTAGFADDGVVEEGGTVHLNIEGMGYI